MGGLLPIPITAVSVVLFLYRQRDVMRTPQPEEFRGLHCGTHVEPRHGTLSLDPSFPNLDSSFLVGQPEPVVRRFVLQAVHSKTRQDTTHLNAPIPPLSTVPESHE